MSSERSILERQIERVEVAEFSIERFHGRRQRKQRNRRIGTAVIALVVAVAGAGGVARMFSSGLTPAGERQPFLGTWVSIDTDGSSQTLSIRASGDRDVEIVVLDGDAGVCSEAPSTVTGIGQTDGAGRLIVPAPAFRCDDGSDPVVESGRPLEEQLRDLTFVHHVETDTLSDNLGVVWDRRGTVESAGGMWPQSSLAEARRAQRLADAGDPRYTWQLLPEARHGVKEPRAVAFFTRFLREELGWEAFDWSVAPGLYAGVWNDWPWEFVVVRCAAGRTNRLYANDPTGRRCAPTIAGARYETVMISADQPVGRGADGAPAGIWLVTRWVKLQPSDAPITGTDHYLRGQRRQVRQEAPISNREATAVVRAFLEARVEGEGADEHLARPDAQIPLLYATTSGAPYERSELELVRGPVWPGGWIEFNVRLFAQTGRTVVEQPFFVDRARDGRLVLLQGTLEDPDVPTTENGEPLAEPYSILDGEVTFGAPPPWYAFFDYGPDTVALTGGTIDADLAVLPDPVPVKRGCQRGRPSDDAGALAWTIRSDPDLEATSPVPTVVGGIRALRMDVVAAAGASTCKDLGTPSVLQAAEPGGFGGPALRPGHRMRLYLLDLPGGSSAKVLTIAFVAPNASFDTILEDQERRIIGSFEFHRG